VWRFVTGHDFSRAETASKSIWALAPAELDSATFAEWLKFFRSLFSPAVTAAK
jgi:hypothetical protein